MVCASDSLYITCYVLLHTGKRYTQTHSNGDASLLSTKESIFFVSAITRSRAINYVKVNPLVPRLVQKTREREDDMKLRKAVYMRSASLCFTLVTFLLHSTVHCDNAQITVCDDGKVRGDILFYLPLFCSVVFKCVKSQKPGGTLSCVSYMCTDTILGVI